MQDGNRMITQLLVRWRAGDAAAEAQLIEAVYPVLRQLARRPWRLLRLLLVAPAALRYFVDRDRGRLKQSLLRSTLRGTPRSEIDALAAGFVRDKIGRGCFDDALGTIRRHREAGHHLVLMSASVDFYVPQFARELGFDDVICTGVAWQGDEIEGTLTTPNRRGEEKARCFQELVSARDDPHTFAYGNSASDLPHLRLARHGLLVNGSTSARRAAALQNVPTAEWT